MTVDLFAGVPVSDYEAAVDWFERLLGQPASFQPHDTESVWILAENRSVYVVLAAERAGGGLVTVMIDDLDSFMAAAEARGVKPGTVEDYGDGVRKAVYRDLDGNEIGVGEAPST